MFFQRREIALLDTNLKVDLVIRRSAINPLPCPGHEMGFLDLVRCSDVQRRRNDRLRSEERQKARSESDHHDCRLKITTREYPSQGEGQKRRDISAASVFIFILLIPTYVSKASSQVRRAPHGSNRSNYVYAMCKHLDVIALLISP